MPKIEAVIFDLGNVLVDFNHHLASDRIAKFSKKSPQDIYGLFFNSPITISFEEGKISPEDFFREVKITLGAEISFDEFITIWNEIFFISPKNKQVYKIAKELKKRYKVAMLSNINILHYQYLKVNFPIFDSVSRVFTSFELGYAKPAKEIYQIVLDELGVTPAETFYTDDRLELIESAAQLGINGFVFTDANKLKEDLRFVGVNIE